MHVVPGLLHAHGSSTPCALLYTEVALSLTCGHWRDRSMWLVTFTWSGHAYNGIGRWTFLAWGSACHSSHWIGRSVSGLRPCSCHRGGMVVHVLLLSSWWIAFEWSKNSQIRPGSDLWHNVQYIYGERERWWVSCSNFFRWIKINLQLEIAHKINYIRPVLNNSILQFLDYKQFQSHGPAHFHRCGIGLARPHSTTSTTITVAVTSVLCPLKHSQKGR